jgi:PEP-CTERM motif
MSFKKAFITATTALLALAATAQAAGVSGQGTWETTLQPRDINADGKTDAFYDSVLKVTWLADANAWAANLNVYGATGWRLPTLVDSRVGQSHGRQNFENYALAVRPGDVSAPIPEPQTLALMLLGLGAVALAARRRAR